MEESFGPCPTRAEVYNRDGRLSATPQKFGFRLKFGCLPFIGIPDIPVLGTADGLNNFSLPCLLTLALKSPLCHRCHTKEMLIGVD
jgi:hypothetical protein